MFDSLDKEAIFKIIDIELRGFRNRLEIMGYTLDISPEAKEFIATKGYDQQYGARPLKRSIQKYLEDPLAELIINSELKPGDTIKVDYDKETDKVLTTVAKALPAETTATEDSTTAPAEEETPRD